VNLSTTCNQVIPIAPFNMTNVYFNFTLANGSIFDQTKVRLSVNNLFDDHNIVGFQQSTASNTYIPAPADLLQLLPARSVTLTVTLGLSPRR